MGYLKSAGMSLIVRNYADIAHISVSDDRLSGGSKMHIYSNLIVLGIAGIALLGVSAFQLLNPVLTFMISAFIYGVLFAMTFANTKLWIEEEHRKKIDYLKKTYESRIKKLKYEHDIATLEKTIRDGTKTLIKNAVDYFKIENIKNEMPPSAAIQNLQLDKYGQIIDLLADFSLILPDYEENQRIVQQEICHQIDIFSDDEKTFADFLRTIMGKYLLTLNKKIRERKKNKDGRLLRSSKKFSNPMHNVVEKVFKKKEIKKSLEGPDDLFGDDSNTSETVLIDEAGASTENGEHQNKKKMDAPPAADAIDATDDAEKAHGDENEYFQYLQKGYYEHKNKNFREAVRLFTLAIDLNPEGKLAYYNRGMSLRQMNQDGMALKDFVEASRLGYDSAQQMVNRIKLSETQEWDNVREMLDQQTPSY